MEENVLDFGADPEGVKSSTEAIASAIEHCNGKLVFPRGHYLSGPIHLRSNLDVYFEEGCRITFSPDMGDYLPPVFTSFEGVRCYNYSPLIYGNGLHDVRLRGKVELDGNGGSWWAWKANEKGWRALYQAGEEGLDVEKRVYGTPEYGLRPVFVQFVNCSKIVLEGLHLSNSPFWTIHPFCCNDVLIRGLVIKNPVDSPNTDSINIESCNHVLVEDCTVLEGGDDIFTIKSGRGNDGRQMGIPCENVEIRNCKAVRVNGGGLVIGSEMSGGVRNIHAHDCSFGNIANGTKIKSMRGRGGYVKDVKVSGFNIESARFAVCVTLKYAYGDGGLSSLLPEIGNLTYEDLHIGKAREAAVLIEGLEDCKIRDVSIRNLTADDAGEGIKASCFANLDLCNISCGSGV